MCVCVLNLNRVWRGPKEETFELTCPLRRIFFLLFIYFAVINIGAMDSPTHIS